MATVERDGRLVHIGKTIRIMRERHNYSQEDMADLINSSPSTICRYESATRILPVDLLLDYAEVFGIPVSRLLPAEYVEAHKRELPEEYYELSPENQKIVQTTMNVLINSLLLQQNQRSA